MDARLKTPADRGRSPWRRLGQRLGLLAHDRDGATAIEFAFVALPFFALLFGILELAMIFIMSTSLDNATATAARTIRTGAAYATGGATTADKFADLICDKVGWVSVAACKTDLRIEVKTYQTFNEIALTDPVTSGNMKDQSTMTYERGAPEDIVLVRAYYRWTLITPLLSQALSKLNGGKALITSTVTFRNEPYS